MFHRIAIARYMLFVVLAAADIPALAVEKWNFATPYTEKEYLTVNDQQFAEDVKKSSGGAIDITIHAGASLFKLPEVKRAVQTRQVAIGEVFLSAWSNEDPIYGLQTLPFLASNIREVRTLWDIHKPYVAARLEKQGLKLLYGVTWPAQSLFTKREIESFKGLAGIKFRVQNPSTARIAELIGVTGVRVETADLPQAFLTGTIDAMFTSNVTTANASGWDYLKYSYSTNSWYPLNIVFINKGIYDRLDPKLQQAVMQAAARAEQRGWGMEASETAAKEKQLRDHGMVIVDPAPAKMMAEFRDVGRTMTDEWVKSAGADGRAILDEFEKRKKQ
jgi:TRAP-type C4-dicarboxylate transport system substrate-binding protein